MDAVEEGHAEDAAKALEATLRDAIGDQTGAGLVDTARGWFDPALVPEDEGGDRDSRIRQMRRWTFRQRTPWLAMIWQRDHAGRVGPHWVIVDNVSDEVQLVDPDPWDGVDEDRVMPTGDFMVLWELSGCAALMVRRR
jgi:hypothetical protein